MRKKDLLIKPGDFQKENTRRADQRIYRVIQERERTVMTADGKIQKSVKKEKYE